MPTRMPTAGRGAAALWFGALGWLVAELHVTGLGPEAVAHGLKPLAMVCGAVAGWAVVGPRVGRGRAAAVVFGIQAGALGLLATLVIAAVERMFSRAFAQLYRDAVEAVIATAGIVGDFALALWAQPVAAGVLAVGSVAGGLFADWAGRRWR